MSLQEAESQCFILTVSSQDTSAAFLSAFVNYILESPEVGSKLLDEISLFERGGKLSSPVVKYDETVQMQFFMACVYETLRLSPSVSVILPRYAPAGGMNLNGIWISERAEVAANPYVIHRNTEIFGSDADTFRPERWLGSPDQVRLMHKFSLGFGYGSRKCLGRNIALFESQKFIVQVCSTPESMVKFRYVTNTMSTKLFRDFDIRSSSPERPFLLQNWGVNVYFEQYIELKARTRDSQGTESEHS